jgi:hypothetical protein
MAKNAQTKEGPGGKIVEIEILADPARVSELDPVILDD